MRAIIGFFGLNRSLRHTAASIEACVYQPLRAAGIPLLRAAHVNVPAVLSNPRSGEVGPVAGCADLAALGLDLAEAEPQSDETIADLLALGRAFPDAFGDEYRSLANLCHQLRSLRRLWAMIERFRPRADDVVLLLRPDLLYLDPIDVAADLAPLHANAADLTVPAWQGWGGVNDRFAFCRPEAAALYTGRADLFLDACLAIGAAHAECLLAYTIAAHRLRCRFTPIRAARIRSDGRIALNDLSMLHAPRTAQPRCAKVDG